MRSSLRKRRFGLFIETLLLIGLVVAVGLGVVALNRLRQATNIQTAAQDLQTGRPASTDTDVNLLAETATPDDVTPSPFPTLDPSATFPQSPPATLRPEDPMIGAACGLRETDINTVVADSTTIVRGTITQVPPARWSTPDGRRPANPHDPQSTGNIIYRPVVMRVDEYLKGEQPRRALVLLARGGTVGQDSFNYCGDPLYTFQKGEQVILFLRPPEEGLGTIPPETTGGPPLLAIVEHYTINSDGQAVNINRQVPLQQLLDEIQAAIRP